jgi:hypothetical protein
LENVWANFPGILRLIRNLLFRKSLKNFFSEKSMRVYRQRLANYYNPGDATKKQSSAPDSHGTQMKTAGTGIFEKSLFLLHDNRKRRPFRHVQFDRPPQQPAL